jgi:HD-like signal output (HDOD) protein
MPAASLNGSLIDAAEYERRLYTIFELPPISPVLLDVFYMAKSDKNNAEQLAANIARDAFLAAEVLRMASSAFYNPMGKQISELRLAVARLGRRAIAALALSRHMLGKTWSGWSHLLDAQLAWRQSVGAGVAVEMILEHGRRPTSNDELFLCALMHSLGRMILLSLFPEIYEGLVECTRRQQSTLLEEELRVFPESHSATMQRLLDHWGISSTVHAPLQHFTSSYEVIRKLDEPMRSQVEAVKLAALVGRIAAGTWERWEQIELPTQDVLGRLGLSAAALNNIIEQTTSDTEMLCRFGAEGPSAGSGTGVERQLVARNQNPISHCLTYHSPSEFDWLQFLMPAAGIRTERITASEGSGYPTIEVDSMRRHVLVDGNEIASLPCSYAFLEQQLVAIVQAPATEAVESRK